MITLRECVFKGRQLHPRQCYRTGFAPSPPGEPPKACVLGAAHAGYLHAVRRETVEPEYFESQGRKLSVVDAVHDKTHPLNMEVRTRQVEGELIERRMRRLNDRLEWGRAQIADQILNLHGPIPIPAP